MSTRKSKPNSFLANSHTSAIRSASASWRVISPRNSAGSESRSPNLVLSCLAKSSAFISTTNGHRWTRTMASGMRHSMRAMARRRTSGAHGVARPAWKIPFVSIRVHSWFSFLQSGQQRLVLHLVLQLDQRIEQRFGPRRTAGHINVHGDDVVHTLQHGVAAIHAAGGGAGAHG